MKVTVIAEFRDAKCFSRRHPVGEVLDVEDSRGKRLIALGLAMRQPSRRNGHSSSSVADDGAAR